MASDGAAESKLIRRKIIAMLTGVAAFIVLLVFFAVVGALKKRELRYWAKKAATKNVGKDGFNQLMYGAVVGNFQLVMELVRANLFKIDDLDGSGSTALMYAASHDDNLEIVKFLLDAGANPALLNAKRQSAYAIACRGRNADMIELLRAVSPYSETRLFAGIFKWLGKSKLEVS